MKELITAALAIPFIITTSVIGFKFAETLGEEWKRDVKVSVFKEMTDSRADALKRCYIKHADNLKVCDIYR